MRSLLWPLVSLAAAAVPVGKDVSSVAFVLGAAVIVVALFLFILALRGVGPNWVSGKDGKSFWLGPIGKDRKPSDPSDDE